MWLLLSPFKSLEPSEAWTGDLHLRPSAYEPGIADRAGGRHSKDSVSPGQVGQLAVHTGTRPFTRIPSGLGRVLDAISLSNARPGSPSGVSAVTSGCWRGLIPEECDEARSAGLGGPAVPRGPSPQVRLLPPAEARPQLRPALGGPSVLSVRAPRPARPPGAEVPSAAAFGRDSGPQASRRGAATGGRPRSSRPRRPCSVSPRRRPRRGRA